MDEVDACLIKPQTRRELHKLLSQHLSNSFQAITREESMCLVFDTTALGVKMRESSVYTDFSKDIREAERYMGSRQTILCSASIPQRQHFANTCFQKGSFFRSFFHQQPIITKLMLRHILTLHYILKFRMD